MGRVVDAEADGKDNVDEGGDVELNLAEHHPADKVENDQQDRKGDKQGVEHGEEEQVDTQHPEQSPRDALPHQRERERERERERTPAWQVKFMVPDIR